jgi:glycine C-acetyltransferase/8-amino-7-oxononanoate synthase
VGPPRTAPDPPAIEGPEAPRVVIDGTPYDWFRGSGYLGLQHHPDVMRAACDATLRYGLRLRDRRAAGCHPCLLEWERAANAFFDCRAAVLLGSGYAGGTVVASALAGDVDVAFVDEQSHPNLADGLAAAGLPVVAFGHRDPDALNAALAARTRSGERPLVASDAVFPITGALAPAAAYVELLRDYEGAILCLDDAHGYGVLGPNGRGTLEHLGLHGEGLVSYGTMSKALGTGGGVIPCSEGLRDRIERRSAASRAMSKPSPGVVAAGARALEIARTRPGLRARLAELVARVRRALRSFGVQVEDSPAPIFCIPQEPGLDCGAVARHLHERERIAVLHATDGGYPNVPAGGCLAFTVSARHEDEQIDRLLAALRRAL